MTERRADFLRAFDAQGDRQGAGTQLQRQRVRFFFGELARDYAAGRKLRLDDWRRKDLSIQHNRHRLADAISREAAKYILILFFDFEVDHPFGTARALRRRQHRAGRLQSGAAHHRAEGQAVHRMRQPPGQGIFFTFG